MAPFALVVPHLDCERNIAPRAKLLWVESGEILVEVPAGHLVLPQLAHLNLKACLVRRGPSNKRSQREESKKERRRTVGLVDKV
jgi:hypothetical protein